MLKRDSVLWDAREAEKYNDKVAVDKNRSLKYHDILLTKMEHKTEVAHWA